MVYGRTVICNNCDYVCTLPADPTEKKQVIPLILVAVVVALAIGAYFQFSNFPHFRSEQSALNYLGKCLENSDMDCRLHAYKSLAKLKPENAAYQANYAYLLTLENDAETAEPIYKNLIAQGEGTYDLMAFYGINQKKLGKNEEAIKWMQNALSINPQLVDTTKELATVLSQAGEPAQAVSLLKSFMERYPGSRGTFEGNIISILESNPVGEVESASEKSSEPLKLLAVADSHHFISLTGENGKTMPFMIDTGASVVSMNSKDFKEMFPNFSGKISAARFSLADGRTIDGTMVTVPKMQVGPWEFKDVEVSVCETCVPLAGKSLLKRFKISTHQKGNLEYMELRRSL